MSLATGLAFVGSLAGSGSDFDAERATVREVCDRFVTLSLQRGLSPKELRTLHQALHAAIAWAGRNLVRGHDEDPSLADSTAALTDRPKSGLVRPWATEQPPATLILPKKSR
jgi:hypothetical protein